VLLNVFYRHSRIKQYLKDGRAMRIETVASSKEQRLPVGGSERGASFDDLDGNGLEAGRGSAAAGRGSSGRLMN
jgi:hypothetical protein